MNASAAGDDLELRHYVDVLRRRKFLIAATVVVMLLAGFAYIKVVPPVYESTAQVLLQPSLAEQVFGSDTGSTKSSSASSGSSTGTGGSASPQVASQVAVIASASVGDPAKKALHMSDASVTVAPIANSNVVGITADSGNAKTAAKIAQTYADTYVDMHRTQVLADLKTTTDALTAQIGALEAQIAPLDQSLSDLTTRIDATAVLTARAPLTSQRDQISQQRQTLDTRRSDLQARLDRLQLDTTVTKTGGVEIVSNAPVPTDPISPQKARDLALALALGILGGIGLAFLRDHFDDRIKSDEDLEDGTGQPVLGAVPKVRGWRRADPPLLVTQQAPSSPAGEAYDRLATVLKLKSARAKLQVIQITSAHPGDGKTATAANLGVAFARSGKSVVVVDANLRRPRLHGFFDLPNDRGLTSVLRGEITLTDALVEVVHEPFLRVLPSGPIPPNPAELLDGQAVRDLIIRLRFEGHLVIFDGPALPMPDAMLLADPVDGVVLVGYVNRTTRSELAESTALLGYVDTPLVGSILVGTARRKDRFFFGRRRDQATEGGPNPTESEPTEHARMPTDRKARVTADQ